MFLSSSMSFLESHIRYFRQLRLAFVRTYVLTIWFIYRSGLVFCSKSRCVIEEKCKFTPDLADRFTFSPFDLVLAKI